jgi:LmbE family N-acetylglucosaminyl deacetylase
MRWIYLSPHFDDAVLSCGGVIFEQSRQGIQTEIWTIFAGDPPPGPLSEFARQNHSLWGLTSGVEPVALRAAEDEEAAGIVAAELVHFEIPDCIYRRTPDGEYLYTESVITPPHRADRRLPIRIRTALRSELRQDDLLVCPLGLGGHVDHGLVRQAAEALRRPLLYYADVPYILNNPQTLESTAGSLEKQLYPVSQAGLEAWLRGVAAYRSQVDSLYKGEGTLSEAIRSYWAGQGGIRLWRIRQAIVKTA